MLALTTLGIATVASLSGNAPLKGVVAACLGILVGRTGTNAQIGQLRWTGDLPHLEDGIPLVPIILGIFALPKPCELANPSKGRPGPFRPPSRGLEPSLERVS